MWKYVVVVIMGAVILGVSPRTYGAETETVRIYADGSDASIQTMPYPGTWDDQYDSEIGGNMSAGTINSAAFFGAFHSSTGYQGSHRSFLSFDTSVIPDDIEIISVVMKVHPDVVMNDYEDEFAYMSVLEGRQASPTVITENDIEMCGNVLEDPIEGSARVHLDSIAVQEQLLFIFNESGKLWINPLGYTKLCIREGHDIQNEKVTNDENYWKNTGITHYTTEYPGTDFDPYLEVTYTIDDGEMSIEERIQALIDDVDTHTQPGAQMQSLEAHVDKLTTMYGEVNDRAVIEQLNIFIKKIKGEVAKDQMTTETALLLVTQAEEIIRQIQAQAAPMVPLVTQVPSLYPSLTETTLWASSTYADGRGAVDESDYCGLTIKQCGCGIASLSMLGRYYGILKGFDGSDVNPLNMDAWLLNGGEQSGYDSAGNIMWTWALAYLGEQKDGRYASRLSLDTLGETDFKKVRSFVKQSGPALGFSYAPGHWLVLDGVTEEGFTVRDPFWYDTVTTNDDKGGSTTTRDYDDSLKKAVLITAGDVMKPLQELVEFSLNSPGELLITDARGNRSGYDPVNNIRYDEIDGAHYDASFAIEDQSRPEYLSHQTKHLILVEPKGSVFTLEVIGTGNGAYALTHAVSTGKGNLHGDTVRETISIGERESYTVITDPLSGELPGYLTDILALIPQSDQKKFIHAFTVVYGQTAKEHVAVTEILIQNLIRYIEIKYKTTQWSASVIAALKAL